jgi:transposase
LSVVPDPERLSRRELVALVYEQQREIAQLRQEVQRLTERLHPPKRQPPRLATLFRRFKRPGQKPGHPGMTRATPTHVDRVIEQRLRWCPVCQGRLGPSVAVTRHLQEDLIPARVEVTRFERYRYSCRRCRQVVTAPPAPEEIPASRLGPQVLAQALVLEYVHGLPFNKIRRAFQQFATLTVSEGALAQALQRLARWLQVETDALRQAIRTSPATHVDETGWKLTGVNHWLWAFVTERLAYCRIDRSRGSGVPKEVLGTDYAGVVISDFHSAYNRLQGPQQKCWVHLLRELRDRAKTELSDESRVAHRRLRRVFRDARRLAHTRSTLPPLCVKRRQRRLEARLFAWGATPYHNTTLRRLAGRIVKHHRSLLTFTRVAGVPPDNNQAERAIRPHVIIRKRSYQSRSPTGMATHAQLMSLVQTLALQGRAIGETVTSAYLRHRHGDLTPVVVSGS